MTQSFVFSYALSHTVDGWDENTLGKQKNNNLGSYKVATVTAHF